MKRIGQRLVSFIEGNHFIILGLLIAIVLVAGIGYSFHLGNQLRYIDEREYYKIADHLAFKRQFSLGGQQPTAFRPPGYPLILAPLILVGANIIHLRILNFIALGLCIYVLSKILKTWSSPLASVLGILIVLCYPVIFYTAGTLYPQTLASLLFLLLIYILSRNPTSMWTYFGCGLLFGYLILTVPVFVFALVIVAIWFWASQKPAGFKRTSITVITALVVVGLWCLRNVLVFGTLIFISTNSGYNLLVGNSENTRPNAGLTVDISKYVDEASRRQLGEIERDAYYRSQALEWIKGYKTDALKLYGLKVLNYFNYRNELYTQSEASAARDLVMLITYGLLLLLSLVRIGMARWIPITAQEVLLIVLYFASALVYAVFFTRIRFRVPFDYLLILIVAMFLGNAIMGWLGKEPTKAGTG